MTRQNKKTLLICLGIVIASYIVRNIVIGAMQIAYYQQQALRPRQRTKPKPAPPVSKAPAAPGTPATSAIPGVARGRAPVHVKPKLAPPSPFAKLSGVWRGRVALDGRGICDLRFELREKQDQPGHFSGYSTMSCNGAGPMMPSKRVDARTRILSVMNPETAILTGAMEKDSIEFRVDKTVADSNGYAPTLFTLTPFGANQLAAEWQEGTCAGGHLILRRARA